MIKIIFADYDDMNNEMLVKQLSMLKERYKCKLLLFDGPLQGEDGMKASWCSEHRPGMFEDFCFSYGGKNMMDTMLAYIKDAEIEPTEVMFISDNQTELENAKAMGMETRSPKAMAKAYHLAMEKIREKARGLLPRDNK